MLSLTYLQLSPDFVDFLSLFGNRNGQDIAISVPSDNEQDCALSRRLDRELLGLSESRNVASRAVIYSFATILKSVESVPRTWPWYICDCAVSDSFDVGFSRTTWLILNGDNLIIDRI